MGSSKKTLDNAKKQQLKDEPVQCNDVEARFLGLAKQDKKTLSHESVYVVLRYYQPSYECFSEWQTDELAAFSDFLTKLSQRTWQDIYQSGGKTGEKTGLGYTTHQDRSKLPKCAAIDSISEDVTFFELRVSQTARVHGFRVKTAFFLVWLDRQHQVYKM